MLLRNEARNLKGCFVRTYSGAPLLPLPPPSKRPAGTWKVCFHAASIARGAHRARRHVHAHVGSPWPADERVCLDMLCGIPFVFGVLLRAQLTPSSRCRRHCALEGCSEFRVQRSYSSLCSRGLLEGHSPTSRSACTIIAIRDKGYVERDVRRMHE